MQYALGLAFFYATLDGLAYVSCSYIQSSRSSHACSFHVALFQLLPMCVSFMSGARGLREADAK